VQARLWRKGICERIEEFKLDQKGEKNGDNFTSNGNRRCAFDYNVALFHSLCAVIGQVSRRRPLHL
jgi:hypothetical protein